MYGALTARRGRRDPHAHDDHQRSGSVLRQGLDGGDVFTFAGDKIARKSSFFKTRSA